MVEWKRAKITFDTTKLGQFIEQVKETVEDKKLTNVEQVYGVTNTDGITVTGKKASNNISNYIVIDKDCFAFNPYRINVGSIGLNSKGLKGCVSPAYVVFKSKHGLHPEFLFLYLKSEYGHHLINWYGNKGGVRNALRYDDLCQIDIPAIDYKSQLIVLDKVKLIQETLADVDGEIASQLSYLKQLRQSVLQEAIEGKLTAKWRKEHPDLVSGENHVSKLLEKIKVEKEKLIKEGKIRESRDINNGKTIRALDMPESWQWAKGEEILFVTKLAGFEYTKYIRLKIIGDVPVIRAQNVRPLKITTDNLLYIDQKTSKILERSALNKECLLVTFIGAGIGDVAHFNEKERWHLAPNVAKMEPYGKTKYLNIKYLNYYLLSSSGQSEIFKHVKATAQPCLSMGTIRDIDYPVPPIAEQNEIVEKIDHLMTMVDELAKQVSARKEQSEQLMQAVLRKAFEG